MISFVSKLPGPPWLKGLFRFLILLLIFYALLKGMQAYLAWHFEHPVEPK